MIIRLRRVLYQLPIAPGRGTVRSAWPSGRVDAGRVQYVSLSEHTWVIAAEGGTMSLGRHEQRALRRIDRALSRAGRQAGKR